MGTRGYKRLLSLPTEATYRGYKRVQEGTKPSYRSYIQRVQEVQEGVREYNRYKRYKRVLSRPTEATYRGYKRV